MTKFIPKIRKNSLLLLAGIVWFIAGFNIMRIGTPDMLSHLQSPILPILLSIIIFYLFSKLVFQKMVDKHSDRIKSYTDNKIVVFKFFDTKSYLIMAFMITLGVLLRNSHLLTPLCLGTFYTGLGGSLISAGIFFVKRYFEQYAD